MKTVTEFPSPTLKIAAQTKKDLITAGKTPEELPQAMGEALKLEGDKLKWMMDALDVVGPRLDGLKRVIVSRLNEGEAAPSQGKLVGEVVFVVENYAQPEKAQPKGNDRGDRGGKGNDRGRGKGRGGKGDRNDKRTQGRDNRGGDSRPARAPVAPRGPLVITPKKAAE